MICWLKWKNKLKLLNRLQFGKKSGYIFVFEWLEIFIGIIPGFNIRRIYSFKMVTMFIERCLFFIVDVYFLAFIFLKSIILTINRFNIGFIGFRWSWPNEHLFIGLVFHNQTILLIEISIWTFWQLCPFFN